jgi:hypothetical protein
MVLSETFRDEKQQMVKEGPSHGLANSDISSAEENAFS